MVTSAPVGYLTPCTSSPSAIATIEHDTLTQAREFTKAEVVQWVWGGGGGVEGGGNKTICVNHFVRPKEEMGGGGGGGATLETQ